MNLLILEPGDVQDGRARVAGQRAVHIRRVLGLGVGDTLRVGIARGRRGVGTVVTADDDGVTVAIDLSLPASPRPVADLVVAMPRPKSLSRLVEAASSLGVGRIDIVNAWRVDKSYLTSSRLDPARLREDAIRGCEQGCTTWIPDTAVHSRLMGFFDTLDENDVRKRLVAHPGSEAHLDVAPAEGRTVIAIGPDGGWIERELDTFDRLGFLRIALTTGVLRTDHAVVAALAQLEQIRRMAR